MNARSNIPPPTGPPSRSKLYGEALGGLEVLRLGSNAHKLARGPKGNGELVITLPGLAASDVSMLPMRQYLTSRNMNPFGWDLGTNTGRILELMPPLIANIKAHTEEFEQPAHLVGWSAGGIAAREVARAFPELVAQVITMGSPIVGGPLFTNAAAGFDDKRREQIRKRILERERRPITVPLTAIYSKRDGIVDWRACVDRTHPTAHNVEVHSTHTGMGIDPDVWLEVAGRIARLGSRPL